ncbi:RTA1 like protein-domain-containing protein [Fusarium flagelliforme]|uniref:RTA1 like protein-domain-containing protein n=1 Tax=Fusarium flagelliforme TaxID=2675880 RepID=UPI001E8D1D23|nr:RTA1 like protein-domain-containing protein [Fusarium flagelliforme]KAH7174047.1 RTA1 like protein-domain-containing protein [Fusarium flagelliforme]
MTTDGLFEPVPGVEPSKGGAYLWRYLPSVAAGVIFLLLFLASFLYISYKIWRTRTYFCIVFAVGCFFEMVGYGIRAGASKRTSKVMPYASQNMFILVAPALFAASIYMILGRIIRSLNADKHSLLKPTKLTRTFVLGDVLSFVIQGGGSGMSVVQNATLAKWAERIVIIGLVVQVVIFGLFCVVSVVFHRRMHREPTAASIGTLIPWETTLYTLYFVSLLIMIRSIFRIIEFGQGYTGYALSHEWTLYVFDALLMWIVTVVYAWRYPIKLHWSVSHSSMDTVALQEIPNK